jgi:prolyl oligopeptidase
VPALSYPSTPRRPEANTIGGISYDDPYQWLEGEDDEVTAWQAAQQQVTKELLGPLAGKAADLIEALTTSSDQSPPAKAGNYWFRQRRPAGEARAVVEVLDGPQGDARVLLDPAALAPEDPHATLMGFLPSPDGELVAFVLQTGGAELGTLRFVRTSSGELLEDAPTQSMRMASIAWFGDSSGVLYNGIDEASGGFAFPVYTHLIGQPASAIPESVPPSTAPMLTPMISKDGRFAFLIGDPLAYRPIFIKNLAAGTGWEPFLQDLPEQFSGGDVVGDELITVTSHQAPRGRIVAIPLATPTDTTTWRELVPQSDAVLTAMTTTMVVDGDRLVVTEQVDVSVRLRIVSLDGTELATVPLPGHGVVTASANGGELSFAFASLTQSSGTYYYDNGQVTELSAPEQLHDDVVTEFRRITGPDGTELSYHLMYRKDLDLTTAPPALVYAYGGWNVPLMPTYSPDQLALAKCGVLIVRPHVRGGGEYGKEWWDGGRLDNKLNTFSDLFFILDRLVEEGVLDPARLAFEGGSNGGMLAGAVATQRPDLFRAVTGVVPVLDLFRVYTTPITLLAVKSDYGDPQDPEYAKVLWSYSPYHNVAEGTEYPATLWLAGANDPRCPAWHARKMAAAMQHADPSGRPQLLSVVEHAGHGSAVKGTMTAMNAEWVAFTLRELGVW